VAGRLQSFPNSAWQHQQRVKPFINSTDEKNEEFMIKYGPCYDEIPKSKKELWQKRSNDF
jgi:hypothetical protein